MAKKKSTAFKSKLAIGFVFVIAVIYSFYHISSLIFSQEIITIASGVTTHSETVGARGYIFRDETLMTSQNTGVVDYIVADGQRVSVDQQVADVYEGNGIISRQFVKTLDRQIALLEKSEIGAQLLDLVTLRKEANDIYLELVNDLNMENTGELDSQIELMMVTLNKINVLTDGKATVAQTLAELKAMRSDLLKGNFSSEYSKGSGYFYYYPDGYETLFNSETLATLDGEQFNELERAFLEGDKFPSADVYGKIAADSSWRFVVSLSKDSAQKMAENGEYRIVFPENNNTDLVMTLENKLPAAQNNEIICVFYCNKLPNGFKLERVQNARIDVSSVSGIYIPRSALAMEDGVRGVYVLRGSVVYFRRVEIVYEELDYCLASVSAADVGEFYALGTNELIITNGKNLFHGRILN